MARPEIVPLGTLPMETRMTARATTLLLAAILACCLLGASVAQAQTQLWSQPTVSTKKTLADVKGGGPFGMGFTAGTRNGLTMKIWPALGHGIVIDFGAPPFLNSMAVAVGYRAHFKPQVAASNSLAGMFYLGFNFRTRLMFMPGMSPATFAEFGVGIPFGLSVTAPGWPIELFVEAGPVGTFWKASSGIGFGIDVDGIAGGRIYF
jgi:hypothetical protein